jgi:hypothetical protein
MEILEADSAHGMEGFCTVASSGAPSDFSSLYKSGVFSAFMFGPMLAAGYLAERSAEFFMRGTAWAILLNVGVGVLQLMCGLRLFPFETISFLYNNNEYEDAQTVGLMLKTLRPFGLYPEPSAMASCITPFLVLFIAYSIGLIKFPGNFDRGCQRILLWAGISGSIFVVISRSAAAVVLAVAILILFVARAMAEPNRVKRVKWLVPPTFFGAGAGAAIALGRLAGGPTESALNGSWEIRTSSIQLGLYDYVTAPWNIILFGYGGLAQATLSAESYGVGFPCLLNYLMNYGLISLACVWRVGLEVSRSLASVGAPAVAWAFTLAYLTGIGFATSYMTLAPTYTVIAVLLLWHRFALPVHEKKPEETKLKASGPVTFGLPFGPLQPGGER